MTAEVTGPSSGASTRTARGDGREWVITRRGAAAVRAEDGRSVAGVDLSPFISGLPSGADTRSFSITNASTSPTT